MLRRKENENSVIVPRAASIVSRSQHDVEWARLICQVHLAYKRRHRFVDH
jgi:hypothetical protein